METATIRQKQGGGADITRRPEIGKAYITRCGARTGSIYPVRETGCVLSPEKSDDAVFEASIPGSHWIEFYREDGTAVSGSHHDLIDIRNDF